MGKLILKPGREKSVVQGHPWIFSGAVDHLEGIPGVGETVGVCSARGEFLGWAAYSPSSQIRARMWTWDEAETIQADFFRKRIQKAAAYRREIIKPGETNAYRLIHAESDGIPGLVVDCYADQLVVQVLSAGPDLWRKVVVEALVDVTGIPNVFERSDVDVRKLEGLPEKVGLLHGQEPPEVIEICENGLSFRVDVRTGHKTGFYLDQRVNRAALGNWARGKSILNCFCYTGGFAVYGLKGDAQDVLSVDTSADALARGKDHIRVNGLDETRASWLEGDVFQVLRTLRDQARSFDLIILDPPKFAPTAAQAERAARGYKDINLLAFKLLRPGGMLFTFSCSGGVSPDLFQKIVAGAALDAGVNPKIIQHMEQGPDHPVSLNFPEGAYLKGLICKCDPR